VVASGVSLSHVAVRAKYLNIGGDSIYLTLDIPLARVQYLVVGADLAPPQLREELNSGNQQGTRRAPAAIWQEQH
jgi:hypothetical protein